MDKTAIKARLKEVLAKAYSPYSKVKVAAAVLYEVNGETRIAYGVNNILRILIVFEMCVMNASDKLYI